MGTSKTYDHTTKKFKEHLYVTIGKKVVINGIVTSVVRKITDEDGHSSNLPLYAGKCDMYFILGTDGKVKQGRLYKNGRAYLDFDWSHAHCNKRGNKEFFPAGTVHVQEYVYDNEGKPTRLSHDARKMTDAEIEKYGKVIHHFNKDVKFK